MYAETEGEENKVECDVSEVAKEVDLPLWKTERMCAWQSDPEVPTGPNTELHEHEVRFWNDMLDVSIETVLEMRLTTR